MRAKLLMVQGTTSNAGKSLLVTALCRIFANRGFRTAPFKAWNMSLNSYVTEDGCEIGRSQAEQARAAGIEVTADMNPFLIKPSGNGKTQIIVRGKPLAQPVPGLLVDYGLPIIEESLHRLMNSYDVVIMEGAGSPVELNIKERDMANMRVALLVDAPVMIVADIDRGGAIAGIVGTMELLEEKERALVIGSVLNKFRGDYELVRSACTVIEEQTKRPVLGVIPYIHDHGVAEEDGAALQKRGRPKAAADDAFAVLAAQVEAHIDIQCISNKMGLGKERS